MEPLVLEEVKLTASHAPTGETRHLVGGSPVGKPSTLRIARYATGSGYYLLYLDEDGQEQTDTYHASVADARRQAAFEFGVEEHESVLHREPSGS